MKIHTLETILGFRQNVINYVFILSQTWTLVSLFLCLSLVCSLCSMTGTTKAATAGEEVAVGSRKWQYSTSYPRFSKYNWSSFNRISCRWYRCCSNTSGSPGVHICWCTSTGQYLIWCCNYIIFQSYMQNITWCLHTSWEILSYLVRKETIRVRMNILLLFVENSDRSDWSWGDSGWYEEKGQWSRCFR